MATDHDFKIKNGLQVENGFLLIGKEAFSSSDGYMGIKTSNMSGTNDYMMISGTGDNNTYISAKNGASVYIRGGGNVSAHQLKISSSNAQFYGNLQIDGNLTVNGTTLTVDTTNLQVQDNNITLNYSTGDSSSTANGAGITIQDAVNSTTDATILWDASADEFDFSHTINISGELYATNSSNNLVIGNSASGNIYLGGGNNNTSNIYLQTGSSIALTLNSSNNATFAGTISSGAITTTGDISLNKADGFVYLNNVGTGNSGIYVRGITSSNTLRSHTTDNFRWEVTGSQKMELNSSGVLNVVGGYQLNGTTVIDSSRNATFASIDIEPSGTIELKDANGSVRGTLQAVAGAPHFRISTSNGEAIGFYDSTTENLRINGSGDVNLLTGSLEIAGTTVIDSSRNLTNIGTISSGSMTVDPSGNWGTGITINAGDSNVAGGGAKQFVLSYGGTTSIDYPHSIRTRHDSGSAAGNTIEFWLWNYGTDNSSTVGTLRSTVINSSGVDVKSGGYLVGGTTVIDSSRNLSNIGTISSGAISATGNSTITGSGSSSNALNVYRGSDSTSALRVLNTGEVLVSSNYFYVDASQGAYFNGNVRVRGGISNDSSSSFGGEVRILDDTNIIGALKINGTEAIDSSRNLSNISTISSSYLNTTSGGVVSISTDGSSYKSGMSRGALEIGSTSRNYRYTSGWSGSMQSGILANTSEDWEFMVHDAGDALGSIFVYESANNAAGLIRFGRNAGYGVSNAVFDGTITSGAITSTGLSSFANFQLSDASKMGFGTVKAGATIGHTASVDEGIFWHTTNTYGIYRTAGAWSSPDYQQLRLEWETGIELDGGSAYGKSGVTVTESDLLISNNATDPTLKFVTTSSSADPVLQMNGQAGITAEGFEIWYDNSVGDVHLHTTYNNSAAAIRFHTRTAASKATSNERFTITGDGNVLLAGDVTHSPYMSRTNTNTLNAGYNWNDDAADLWINYRGYQDGTTRFRDFRVGDGKNVGLLFVDGSARSLDLQNNTVLKVNGTTVIDSSRNLTNIGTITTTGKATIDNAVVADSLYIRGDANGSYSESTLTGGITLWGSTGASTSQIFFKQNNQGSPTLGNHGYCTDDFNTYFVMDTTNRGWVFRNASTDTNVASISNTGGAAFNTGIKIGTTEIVDSSRNLHNIPNMVYYQQYTVDMTNTSTYAENTYYPVTISSAGNGKLTRLRIEVGLNSGSTPSWSTHSNGFSLLLDWHTSGNGWGTVYTSRRIMEWTERWTTGTIVGGIEQMVNSSYEVVYLRGGGKYFFYSDKQGISITPRSSTFTSNNQSVSPSTSIINDVWSSAANSVGLSKIYAENVIVNSYDSIATDGSMVAPSFRLGTNDRWKIRPNNGNAYLSFEYSTSSGLADTSIKAEMGNTGNFIVGDRLTNMVSGYQMEFKKANISIGDGGGAGSLNLRATGNFYLRHNGYDALTFNGSSIVSSDTFISGSGVTPTGNLIGNVRSYGSTSAYMGASDESGRTAFFGVDSSGYAMFGALTNHDAVIRANNQEKLRVSTNGQINITNGKLVINNSSTSFDALDVGASTQSGYVNLIYRTNSGNAQIWKQGTASDSWGGPSAINIYNSNGLIGFHPQGTANVLQIDSGGPNISGSKTLRHGGNTIIDSSRNLRNVTAHATDAEYGQSMVGNFGQWLAHSRYASSPGFNTNVDYWGWNFVQGNVNAPHTSSGQWYRNRVSLGNQYGHGSSAGDYWLEMAYPRTTSNAGQMYIRACENGSIGSWYEVGTNIRGSQDVAGNIVAGGNITAYSDERLKSNIQTLDGSKVLQMRGVSFTKNEEAGSGVIAQELEKIAPELVYDNKDGYKSVAYGNLTGYLIEAVKLQQQKIEKLEELVEKLISEK